MPRIVSHRLPRTNWLPAAAAAAAVLLGLFQPDARVILVGLAVGLSMVVGLALLPAAVLVLVLRPFTPKEEASDRRTTNVPGFGQARAGRPRGRSAARA